MLYHLRRLTKDRNFLVTPAEVSERRVQVSTYCSLSEVDVIKGAEVVSPELQLHKRILTLGPKT